MQSRPLEEGQLPEGPKNTLPVARNHPTVGLCGRKTGREAKRSLSRCIYFIWFDQH